MRYLIHLLPTEAESSFLTDLRDRVAARIGTNKALDYPVPHITLVADIEDGPDDPEPIYRQRLEVVLDTWRARESIGLTAEELTIWGWGEKRHVVFPIVDSAELKALRDDLLTNIKSSVAGPGGRYRRRAAQVQAQPSPHLTLAQDVTTESAKIGIALIESMNHPIIQFRGVELVLLERRIPNPYRIVHRVSLTHH